MIAGDHNSIRQVSVRRLDRPEWERLAPEFMDYNYRQTWAYGQAMAQRHGAEHRAVAIGRDAKVIGLASVRIKRVPLGLGGVAYVSAGPLVRRGADADTAALSSVLSALRDEFAGKHGLVVRLTPPACHPSWAEEINRRALDLGLMLTDRVEAERTLLVDLNRPLDAVRAGLASNWRNHLKQSERNRLVIRTGADAAIFDEFAAMHDRFVQRKGFAVELGAEFYLAVQRETAEFERFTVALAEHDGQVIAGHVISMLGDTSVNLLRASEPQAMKLKATYLLQWTAIELAHAHGAHWFDLGGIDPEGNPGVYEFKRGLKGVEVRSPGPFECAPSGSIGAGVTRSAENAYLLGRKVKRLLARSWQR